MPTISMTPRIAIIGAGTAGLACAIALAREGAEVDIFERHPTLAPVGAGMLIQPGGLLALRELGALDAFAQASVPIHRLEGRSHRSWLLVDIPYAQDLPARAVTRPAMTRVLQQRAGELGVRLHLDAPIAALEPSRDRVLLRWGEHEQVYDGAVIASGSGSDLAQQCGLSAPTSPYAWGALNGMISVADWQWPTILHQRMHGPRKLFGLMPCSYTGAQLDIAMFWSLPVARHAQWQASDLAAWKAELVRFWPQSRPVVDQIRDHSQFSFATYRHAWPKRLAQGRICLVGDAAHAMSPQLGLGSTLAMGDALALARGLRRTGDIEAGFRAYARERRRRVQAFQLLSRALTPCFQADLPAWWRDLAFGLSVRIPGFKRLMRASVGG